MSVKDYYVYLYIDPTTNTPFYVGMGRGNRMFDHLNEVKKNQKRSSNKHKINKIRKILESGNQPLIVKVDENISFEQAIELEIFMIEWLGRDDLKTGKLTNLTNGGEGGLKPSEETIEKKKATNIKKFGVEYPSQSFVIKEKIRNRCLEKFGVDSYSKTVEHKQRMQEVFNRNVTNGSHWVLLEENKKIISENTKKQIKEGKHFFKSQKHKEERSKYCKENNSKRNNERKNRNSVLLLKQIYSLLNKKEPRGGLWNKPDAWLEEEINKFKIHLVNDRC